MKAHSPLAGCTACQYPYIADREHTSPATKENSEPIVHTGNTDAFFGETALKMAVSEK